MRSLPMYPNLSKSHFPKNEDLRGFADNIIVTTPKKISVNLTFDQLKMACTELVTVNGRSFALLEDFGFTKIVDPILKAMPESCAINPENIKHEVHKQAFDRSTLGINVQYIKRKQLVLRSLAMKELKRRHTATYIASTIADVLTEFNIDLKQIYSVTSDNGANMVKAISILSEQQTESEEAEDVKYFEDNGLQNVENIENVHSVTRWHSTHDMLQRRLLLKQFCEDMSPTIKELHISTADWAEIENVVSAVKPAKIATKALQEENLMAGDFYGTWLKYPRFKVVLNETQIESAKNYIIKVWEALPYLENSEPNLLNLSSITGDNGSSSSSTEDDVIENFLKEAEKRRVSKGSGDSTTLQITLNSSFEEQRQKRDCNIINYWMNKENVSPDLQKISFLCLLHNAFNKLWAEEAFRMQVSKKLEEFENLREQHMDAQGNLGTHKPGGFRVLQRLETYKGLGAINSQELCC
ncbi:hypothetical protein ILUMI_01046 [Ignelater luminosus]|uniref:Uncharacterized protein n=1 Tax=Ignelater luminosus TaxID=2038154 RepID=A0A8K0DFC6_IGNLU|nr:hypothetical protein ILUMI_01046 [Ignelater luminosus]